MFKCVCCDGKTKVVQTRSESDKVIRKIKCLQCNKMFYTQETFLKYTEDTYRKEIERGALFKADAIAIPDRYKTKVSLKGARSNQDILVQLVSETKPLSREDLIKMYQNIDTSGVGIIPPEV